MPDRPICFYLIGFFDFRQVVTRVDSQNERQYFTAPRQQHRAQEIASIEAPAGIQVSNEISDDNN
jgi:hypothetical protein